MSDRPRTANDGSVPPEWQPRHSCVRAVHASDGSGRRGPQTILPPPLAPVPEGAVPADEPFAGYTQAQCLRAERAELELRFLELLPAPLPVVERHPELWPVAVR